MGARPVRGASARWAWLLARIVRQIWFRAALISAGSIALAVAIAVWGGRLPYRFGGDIGQESVGTILQIMASSMLAVTTFSLTAMVSAYGSATQLATPRATELMLRDPTSQNALSTFLGAFVFAIVGVIGIQGSLYGQEGRTVLFAATVVVVGWVVVTLLRWIAHIAAFGRMADVIDRVEDAATRAMADFAAAPQLGGRPAITIPDGAASLCAREAGYVTHVDVAALGRIAADHALRVHVVALPGTLVDPRRPLLRIEGAFDDAAGEELREAFSIERHRSFDQDPRLGLIALAEIASRALSPAVNDPGTAIEVLNALVRVFLKLDTAAAPCADDAPLVHVATPDAGEMVLDALRPIARDGGGTVEVALRFASTLAALTANLPTLRPALAAHGPALLDRMAQALTDDADRAAFAAVR